MNGGRNTDFLDPLVSDQTLHRPLLGDDRFQRSHALFQVAFIDSVQQGGGKIADGAAGAQIDLSLQIFGWATRFFG